MTNERALIGRQSHERAHVAAISVPVTVPAAVPKLSPRLSLRRAKTASFQPTPAKSLGAVNSRKEKNLGRKTQMAESKAN